MAGDGPVVAESLVIRDMAEVVEKKKACKAWQEMSEIGRCWDSG